MAQVMGRRSCLYNGRLEAARRGSDPNKSREHEIVTGDFGHCGVLISLE
jgi:hypothetical protein